jgi:hypothetical protein
VLLSEELLDDDPGVPQPDSTLVLHGKNAI